MAYPSTYSSSTKLYGNDSFEPSSYNPPSTVHHHHHHHHGNSGNSAVYGHSGGAKESLRSSSSDVVQSPLKKLTVDLIKTYRNINEVLYCTCTCNLFYHHKIITCTCIYVIQLFVSTLLFVKLVFTHLPVSI